MRGAAMPRAPGRWRAQHGAWLLFAPPALLAGLRALLEWLNDRQNAPPALALQPLSTPSGAFDLLWPIVAGLALLAALVLLLRRLGRRRALPLLGGLWLALWLGGSAALLQRHLNAQGLHLRDGAAQAAAPNAGFVSARVLANRFKPPSLRGAGGSALVLRVAGLEAPRRLLLDDPRAKPIKPGDTLALQLARGRFSGLFVTDWRVASAAMPAPATASPR